MPILTGLFDGEIGDVNAGVVIFFIGLAVFSLQFFCCWKWDNLFVRLLPSIVALSFTAYFFIMMTQVAEGWDAIGYLFLMIYAAIMLGVTILGWIAWGIFCFCHNKVSRNPEGY